MIGGTHPTLADTVVHYLLTKPGQHTKEIHQYINTNIEPVTLQAIHRIVKNSSIKAFLPNNKKIIRQSRVDCAHSKPIASAKCIYD